VKSGIDAIRAHTAWVPQTDAEERASAAVHGVGAVLSLAALYFLTAHAIQTAGLGAALACAVYGITTFLTMLASTLFHSAPRGFDPIEWLRLEAETPRRVALPFRDRELRRARRARRRRLWLAFDHCAIFAMIAGTYTPILLLAFPPETGIPLLALEWTLAAVGIAVRLSLGRLHWTMIPVFLGMGWLGFLWTGAIADGLGPQGAAWLLAGGLVYTAGLVFYLWRSLPFNHALWHAFVVAGAACHFVVMADYAMPA
jgi:hemolysin III